MGYPHPPPLGEVVACNHVTFPHRWKLFPFLPIALEWLYFDPFDDDDKIFSPKKNWNLQMTALRMIVMVTPYFSYPSTEATTNTCMHENNNTNEIGVGFCPTQAHKLKGNFCVGKFLFLIKTRSEHWQELNQQNVNLSQLCGWWMVCANVWRRKRFFFFFFFFFFGKFRVFLVHFGYVVVTDLYSRNNVTQCFISNICQWSKLLSTNSKKGKFSPTFPIHKKKKIIASKPTQKKIKFKKCIKAKIEPKQWSSAPTSCVECFLCFNLLYSSPPIVFPPKKEATVGKQQTRKFSLLHVSPPRARKYKSGNSVGEC